MSEPRIWDLDEAHFKATKDKDALNAMDISEHYIVDERPRNLRAKQGPRHPLYNHNNNIHRFGRILQSDWVSYVWHNTNAKIQCVSTLDCGQGKDSVHPPEIVAWDHIDNEKKKERVRIEVERSGKPSVTVNNRLSVGYLITQARTLNIYFRNRNIIPEKAVSLWRLDNPNFYSPLYFELLQCRPLCSNCHAIETSFEARHREIEWDLVLGWMEKRECDELIKKQLKEKAKHQANKIVYSGSVECKRIETNPELLKLARIKIDQMFMNFQALSEAEFRYVKNHADYRSGIMNRRNFPFYIDEYRQNNDLFLKN